MIVADARACWSDEERMWGLGINRSGRRRLQLARREPAGQLTVAREPSLPDWHCRPVTPHPRPSRCPAWIPVVRLALTPARRRQIG
jgi:hypothetical protein